jgi:hypothetical protein
MPHKPVPTDLFRKFLKHIKCKLIGTKKHEKWDRDDLLRPIIFRPSKKEIPADHIKNNLDILGMTRKEFDDIISNL